MKQCHKCHTLWPDWGRQPGFRETCEKCSQDLHVCLNCKFFDESKTSQCQIPNIDTVVDKEKFNFCEEFQFSEREPGIKKTDNADNTKQKWEKLFKK